MALNRVSSDCFIANRRSPNWDDWSVVDRTAAAEKELLRCLWSDASGSVAIAEDAEAGTAPSFHVTFSGVAVFRICFATREIVICRDDLSDDDTIHHLLVDQIWPRIIAHGGDLVVHASAVLTRSGAILFVGPSGRGKSTLAASLHQRGHPLLGDDAIVVAQRDGRALCEAVYPSLRLFPDSLATVFTGDVEQSAVAHYTAKRNVHLAATESGAGEHAVRAIFLIDGDESHEVASVTPLTPSEACMKLVEHSFWLDPTDLARTARKLRSASALAGSVPTYTLAYPRDFARIPEVHAALFGVLD